MPPNELQINGRIGWAKEVLWLPTLLSFSMLLIAHLTENSKGSGGYPFFPNCRLSSFSVPVLFLNSCFTCLPSFRLTAAVLTALPMKSDGLLEYYQLIIYIFCVLLLLGGLVELTPRAVIIPAYVVNSPNLINYSGITRFSEHVCL